MEFNDSTLISRIHSSSLNGDDDLDGVPMLIHGSFDSSPPIYQFHDHPKNVYFQHEGPEKAFGLAMNFTTSNASGFSSGSSSNSHGLRHRFATSHDSYLSEERHSGIMFNHTNGSLISFHESRSHQDPRNLYPRVMVTGEDNEFSFCGDDLNPNSYMNIPSCRVPTNLLPESSNSRHAALQLSWLSNQEENLNNDGIQDCRGREESIKNKRPSTGVQELDEQYGVASKKPKLSTMAAPSKGKGKDPQTIAAKNRRERISERLKTLQDLVPNGSKVDLVTMLEKAISYVKFLQLQVKVLATDEFWPAQGTGKAPELSQVKEAIDAILRGQEINRNSS